MNIFTPKNVLIALLLALLALAAVLIWRGPSNQAASGDIPVVKDSEIVPENVDGSDQSDLIRVASPQAGATVKSPLSVSGQARGTWFFEASFPVRILDAANNELGRAIATAQSAWMTTNFVPFTATLDFSRPTSSFGYLILQKDNPSGLPEHDAELRLPVNFDLSASTNRSIKLYYYNAAKDEDATGNIMCSAAGLVAVEREIPFSQTPIQDAIRLLLEGKLSVAERGAGLNTEFPLPGVSLQGASLKSDGALVLEFSDSDSRTGGGSCRSAILWAQIVKTAQQFPSVKSVSFTPDYLFQP